jgi:hypothetical protein
MIKLEINNETDSELGKLIDELEEKIEEEEEKGFLTVAGKFCEDIADVFIKRKQMVKARTAFMNASGHYQEVIKTSRKGKAPLAEKGLRRVKEKLAKLAQHFT